MKISVEAPPPIYGGRIPTAVLHVEAEPDDALITAVGSTTITIVIRMSLFHPAEPQPRYEYAAYLPSDESSSEGTFVYPYTWPRDNAEEMGLAAVRDLLSRLEAAPQ